MERRAEQIHGVEPRNEWRPRIVQDRASGRIHMMAAVGANKRSTGCQLLVSAFLAAGRALKASSTKAHVHDARQTGVIIRKALEELADLELRRCERDFLAHEHYMT